MARYVFDKTHGHGKGICICDDDLDFIYFINGLQRTNEEKETYNLDECIEYAKKLTYGYKLIDIIKSE